MSTFDDKLFEVVKEVADVREMVGEKPLTETFAAKEHTHRVSDIEIYSEDVITEYGNNVTNGLSFLGNLLFTHQQESDGYSFKLKNVPQGEWYRGVTKNPHFCVTFGKKHAKFFFSPLIITDLGETL